MTMQVNSILVASDLSEASDAVVKAAGAMAAAEGAALHVIHAFDIPLTGESIYGETSPRTFIDRVARVEAALDEQIARTVDATVEVASRCVEIYVAHKAIADRAETIEADLIVVGAHSHRRMGDDLLGSTADRVIRSADVPVLVVRAPLRLPLRRVLAPVDSSPAALGSLRVAMQWSLALGGGPTEPALRVVHLIPRALDIPEFSVEPGAVAARLRTEVEAARAAVEGAAGLTVHEDALWADSIVDEIVRLAGNEGTDLIVIGTHGQGMLKRFLIGSVASGVARRAPCAVMLVPPSLWKEGMQTEEAGSSSH